MSYSTSPTLDAERHFEVLDKANDRLAKQEAYYRAVITDTLTKDVRKVRYQSLSLPATDGRTIRAKPLVDVVSDEVAWGKPLEALMDVIVGSDCPMVAELRKAIADSYSESNADYLGEVSV